jgi:hypothetical protein
VISRFGVTVQISFYFIFFFFFNFLDLYKASFLFQVNSPNLKPIIQLLIIRSCQDFPEYIFTTEYFNILGIVEDLENTFFSAFLKKGYLLYKKIFFQKIGEQ